jgi:hypothetical protein
MMECKLYGTGSRLVLNGDLDYMSTYEFRRPARSKVLKQLMVGISLLLSKAVLLQNR